MTERSIGKTQLPTQLLWEHAVPLARAPQAFAPPELAERFKELVNENSLSSMLQAAAEAAKAGKPIGEAITASSASSGELSTLRQRLERAVLIGVRKGALKAYGFVVPRRAEDRPVEVPADLWSYPVMWDKSAVSGNGMRVEAVRVIESRRQVQLLADQTEVPEPRRQGRPSKRSLILRAFDALDAEGAIDRQGPIKAVGGQIRAWIAENAPEKFEKGKGLGDGVIYEATKARFRTQL